MNIITTFLRCAAACFFGGATAQELVWQITGHFGRQIGLAQISGIGDIDGDGHEDLAAIVNGWCTFGATQEFLWLISGRDGALIREVRCSWVTNIPGWGGFFWRIGAAGDWNDDGVADYFALGSGVDVRSGVDDSVLFVPRWSGTETVADIDVDGDGREDFVTGSWATNGGWGEVRVFDHDGQQLYRLLGGTANGHTLAIAQEIAALNDVDGDGCDDFVMGVFETTGVGGAVVVSGRTGAYLQVCYGIYPNGNIGYVVDSVGDLDGDGAHDFAAGNFGTLFVPVGIATVFSSRTGAVLHQIAEPSHTGLSTSLAGRGVDLDGDGIPDLLLGAPLYYWGGTNQQGAMYTYSGRDGTELQWLNQYYPNQTSKVGYWSTVLRPPVGEHTGLSIVADNNCGFVQAQLPSGNWCAHMQGAIRAYRGTPRTAAILGPSCHGTLSTAPDIGMRTVAGRVRIHLSRAPSNAPAVLLVGLSTTQHGGAALPHALDPYGFPGCVLRTSIDAAWTTTTGSQGIDAGYAYVDLPLPVAANGIGTWSVSAQWAVLGTGTEYPGGWTQAIRWRR